MKNKKTTDRCKTVNKILNRGVIIKILPDKESFGRRLADPTPMKIYIGADPTSTSLHLSHAKNYMLLEEFRQLGHEVIILIGDFTARIGDPTDKKATRIQLSPEEVIQNSKEWIKQIKPLMNFDDKDNPPKIVFNNDWLAQLTMQDVITLSSHVTVQRMLERDMFQKRIKEDKPIHMHEFMYPLMQGYDSVALDVDAELCGIDQTFNALMGRTLLKKYSNKEKYVVLVNLMENPKTGELMSKSRGTGVFLNTTSFEMYSQIMSQPDEMIEILLINNTRIPLEKIKKIMQLPNPRDAKMQTAYEITKIFHGIDAAEKAQNKFIKMFQRKEAIDDMPQIEMHNNTSLLELLKKCFTGIYSNAQIRRLIKQNAIRIDGMICDDEKQPIIIPDNGSTVKVGKTKWIKIIHKTN